MYEITLTVQQTPYGIRVVGPDTEHAIYLPFGIGKPAVWPAHFLWSSDELEMTAAPAVNGVQLNLKVRRAAPEGVQVARRAA
jgi:hypothetical protein